jgi:hypothetical protein
MNTDDTDQKNSGSISNFGNYGDFGNCFDRENAGAENNGFTLIHWLYSFPIRNEIRFARLFICSAFSRAAYNGPR